MVGCIRSSCSYLRVNATVTTSAELLYLYRYPSREAFAADVRLIFANCRTFNEDDSEVTSTSCQFCDLNSNCELPLQVGKSGIALGRYFEKQWLDANCSSVP